MRPTVTIGGCVQRKQAVHAVVEMAGGDGIESGLELGRTARPGSIWPSG